MKTIKTNNKIYFKIIRAFLNPNNKNLLLEKILVLEISHMINMKRIMYLLNPMKIFL
jgi:hypothetical protein